MLTRLLLLAPLPALLVFGFLAPSHGIDHTLGLALSGSAAVFVVRAQMDRRLPAETRTVWMMVGLSLVCIATAGLVRAVALPSLALATIGVLLALLAAKRRRACASAL